MIAPAAAMAAGQKETNRIEELLKTVSASRLNCWHQCRLKFHFRYVRQIKRPPTPALHSGSVAHAVLQAWNQWRWRGEPFQIERLKTLFEDDWETRQQDHVIDWEGEEAKQRDTTWACLEAYFLETPVKNDERPEGVEVRVEADLSHYGLPVLVGIIDLVRAGGRIVDFKTAGKTPDPEQLPHQHSTQLAAYGVLYREATGKRESGFELHHLIRTKTPKVIITSLEPMTAGQETRLFKLIDSYVTGLGREDFVPSQGLQCAGCDFFNECRRWH
jgi:putative RecB family exonuclease